MTGLTDEIRADFRVMKVSRHLVKVKVKLRFSAPSAGITEIEQT